METREIKSLIKDLQQDFNKEERKEIIEEILNEEVDFELFNYRFIHKDEIDEILVDELESDPYILGCFTPGFIADNTSLSCEIIEALQEAGKFEEIGQYIIDNEDLNSFAEAFVCADSYGHHFSHYDGYEHEAGDFYYFRLN